MELKLLKHNLASSTFEINQFFATLYFYEGDLLL